jgi:ATP-dependent DNA helicase RecQ
MPIPDQQQGPQPANRSAGRTKKSATREEMLKVARERFGVAQFRPGQLSLIESALAGKNVVGLMPTGAGKSLTYQLPTLFLHGVTVVVSPLIALMQDQHEKLEERDIPTAKLNSTLSAAEERAALSGIEKGAHELVYVTPERLENPEYLDLLRKQRVSLFVVDEAHCVSQWGHDFRPAYLALRDAIRELGNPPVMALTATATPEVQEDIVKQLRIEGAKVVSTGVERKNLSFEVIRTPRAEEKRTRLLEMLRKEEGVGIVYAATVRMANELYDWLKDAGIGVARYHAKLPIREREETQRDFMADKYKVIVATQAFGLGIDKPDIRFVIHYSFPDSLERYYQEAGRAGRDGKPARVVLLYRVEDKRIQTFFLAGKYPSREESKGVLELVKQMGRRGNGVAVAEIAAAVDIGLKRIKVIVSQLEAAGLVRRNRLRVTLARELSGPSQADLLLSEYESRREKDQLRLHRMMRYAQTTFCRVRYIREYFGEVARHDCGTCDACRVLAGAASAQRMTTLRERLAARAGSGAIAPPPAAPRRSAEEMAKLAASVTGLSGGDAAKLLDRMSASPRNVAVAPSTSGGRFRRGLRVRHPEFGFGEVMRVDGSKLHVDFIRFGAKTIESSFVVPVVGPVTAPPRVRTRRVRS